MAFNLAHGPQCRSCGGATARAVRTRAKQGASLPGLYLAFEWACTVCGQQQGDDADGPLSVPPASAPANASWSLGQPLG